MSGDLFHAIIQVGYAYEALKSPEILAEGLAWLSTSYCEFPKLNPTPVYKDVYTILDLIHENKKLPKIDLKK